MFLTLGESGAWFCVVKIPSTSKVPPTFKLPAIPAPPATINAPLPKFVLDVVPSTNKFPLNLTFPVTSKLSAGAVLLIPTFVFESILIAVCVVPALLTLISILLPLVLCVITPASPSTSNAS